MEKITEDLNFIQSLPDQPTMSTDELKRQFDRAGNVIKKYINDIQIPELENFERELTDSVDTQISTLSSELTSKINTAIQGVETEMSELQTSVTAQLEEMKSYVDTQVAGTLKYDGFVNSQSNIGASVYGNSSQGVGSVTIEKAGYYPIGIGGYNFTGQNGANYPASFAGISMSSQQVGKCVVSLRINGSKEAATYGLSGTVQVTWVKV